MHLRIFGYSINTKIYDSNEKIGVVASTIWGSQYDQTMFFLQDVINKNVSDTTKYIFNSTGMGYISETINPSGTMDHIYTGTNNNYKTKNIFDLAGNYGEKTATEPYRWSGDGVSSVQYRIRGLVKTKMSSGEVVGYELTPASSINSVEGAIAMPRLQLYIK